MVDTGSTCSFISNKVADAFFAPFKFYEPFELISTHGVSEHTEAIITPIFKLFKENQNSKFYVYDIDKFYDGLIGINLLRQLNAVIDLEKQLLITSKTEIPILFRDKSKFQSIIDLSPRTEQRVSIPTNLENGEGIVEYTEFSQNVRMPAAIVKCENGYASTMIQNTSELNMLIKIDKPFDIIKCEYFNINQNYPDRKKYDQLLSENLSKLRTDHMNEEERQEIINICYEFRDIFYHDEIPLTFTNEVKHNIRTKNEDPIYIKPYRQPPSQTREIKNQVEQLLKHNVIQPSFSPWSAPVHLVPKKLDASGEQKYRMVVDYRKLNEITLDDKYPLPNINDLFDKLGNSIYFTTLDLASGYHQIEISSSDIPKTAFSTQFGHFEFTRMPFGLKTAPATFQRAMDNILRGLQGIHCLIYLDDIIIFSKNLTEHIIKLRKVFDVLRKANLKIQLDKSEFLRKEVLYLGHTITNEGLKPNEDKIKAVLNYPIPKTPREIKGFLGLVGYYRRFIKDFSKITKPMTLFLKKGSKIKLTEEYVNAFETCKSLLVNAPLLQYPDFSKPFILTTDASNVALGAVLSQGNVGNDKPVAYASRTLNDAETKYSAIEKELLAVIWAVKYFRPYLYGTKFQIYTDHRPLAWLYSLKEPNSKLTRWRLRLQEYDFEIIYKKGSQNTIADALSRIKINTYTKRSPDKINLDEDSEATLTASEVESDVEEEPSSTISKITSAIDTKPKQILVYTWFKNEIGVKNITRGKQLIIETHLPLDRPDLVKQFLKENIEPNKKYYIYFEDKNHRETFNTVIAELFRNDSVKFIECTERVVVIEDENEQKNYVLKYHEGKTCHRGIKETLSRLKRNYYWPNMHETTAAVINACTLCKRMKYDRNPLKPMIQLTQTQNKPFEELFIDLFSIEGNTYLTIVDAFSKLGQALKIENRSTPEVVRALIKYFSYYGTPTKISCDAGSEFNNSLMKETLSFYKIDLHIGTPNNPNSMGIVERFHSTLIEIYRLAKYDEKITDATSIMTYAIMAYNNTIHSITGFTPNEVVFGHTTSRSVFDIDFEKNFMQKLLLDHAKRTKVLYKHLTEKMIEHKENIRNKRKHDEPSTSFDVGDKIYTKVVNQRKGKDKPRYDEAIVSGDTSKNIIPVTINERETKVPVKNVKRPGISDIINIGYNWWTS